jgi:cobalt-zinc-cadmium efflux system membrane fusion protein
MKSHNNISAFLFPALAIFAIALLVSCSGPNTPEPGQDEAQGKLSEEGHEGHEEGEEETVELTAAQVKEAGITTGTFTYKSLNEAVSANGTIELPPNNVVSISVPMAGFVENIRFLEGAKVKKGQILVELKHPSYVQLQQSYAQARSSLGFLEKELERQKVLSDANVSAKKVYQKTEADHQSKTAEVNSLAAQLSFLGIAAKEVAAGKIQSTVYLRAPFAGTVTQLNAHRGQLANPGLVIMEVIDTEHMHVELQVFQKDIPRVKENMDIRFRIPAYQDEKVYSGNIKLVGKNLDSETKTIRVHGHFEESPELIPGLYVEADILLPGNRSRALPENVVFSEEGNWYFFVQKKGDEPEHISFEKVAFTPGITASGYTQVLDFDRTKDTLSIVTENAFTLKSEMKKGEGGHQH